MREEQQAAKTEQKERLAEEKRLSGALSPFRQFDRFSPADLHKLEQMLLIIHLVIR